MRRGLIALLFIGIFLGIVGVSLWYTRAGDISGSGAFSPTATIGNATPTISSIGISEVAYGSDTSASGFIPTVGADKVLHVSGVINDVDGGIDISTTSVVFYRTGAGASCVSDKNDCYRIDTCSLNAAYGTSEEVAYDCAVPIAYFTDSTASGGKYPNDTWTAYMTTKDSTGRYATTSKQTEIQPLLALNIPSTLSYGSVPLGSTSGAAALTFAQRGNTKADVQISGGSMNCSHGGSIPVSSQRWSLASTTTYASSTPLSASTTLVSLSLGYRTVDASELTTSMYWRVSVPATGVGGTCSGNSTISVLAAPFFQGIAQSYVRLASSMNGVPALGGAQSYFGTNIASIGDLNADGVNDVAVSAHGYGVVYIFFMKNDGTVASYASLSNFTSGYFGSSLAAIGDVNGDGIPDIAIGDEHSDVYGGDSGIIWIYKMNRNGTAQSIANISPMSSTGYFPRSLNAVGDYDGDGITEIEATSNYGLEIIYLASSGYAKSRTRAGPDAWGMYYVGDRNSDGIADILTYSNPTSTLYYMNSNGTIASTRPIVVGRDGWPNVPLWLCSTKDVGDLDGDGIKDLIGGDIGDDGSRGAIYVLFMNSDYSVKSYKKIGSNVNGGPPLTSGEGFGIRCASLGDINGDSNPDLFVGAYGYNSYQGEAYTLFLK